MSELAASRMVSEIKMIIDLLMDKPHSVVELRQAMTKMQNSRGRKKELTSLEIEAQRKRTSRYISWLREWGLVKGGKDGRWYCYPYLRKFQSRAEYDAFLNHSRNLVLGLEAAKMMQENGKKRIVECARVHLRAYPEINTVLINAQRADLAFTLAKNRLTKKLLLRLEGNFPGQVDRAGSPTKPVYVGDNIMEPVYDLSKCRAYGFPGATLQLELEGKIMLGSWIIGRGEKLLDKLNSFISREIKKATLKQLIRKEEASKAMKAKLGDEIERLILKIENGEPLAGICELCPNIKVGL